VLTSLFPVIKVDANGAYVTVPAGRTIEALVRRGFRLAVLEVTRQSKGKEGVRHWRIQRR